MFLSLSESARVPRTQRSVGMKNQAVMARVVMGFTFMLLPSTR
jgi:hypothetical protein